MPAADPGASLQLTGQVGFWHPTGLELLLGQSCVAGDAPATPQDPAHPPSGVLRPDLTASACASTGPDRTQGRAHRPQEALARRRARRPRFTATGGITIRHIAGTLQPSPRRQVADEVAALAAHPDSFFTIPHFDGCRAVLIWGGAARGDHRRLAGVRTAPARPEFPRWPSCHPIGCHDSVALIGNADCAPARDLMTPRAPAMRAGVGWRRFA